MTATKCLELKLNSAYRLGQFIDWIAILLLYWSCYNHIWLYQHFFIARSKICSYLAQQYDHQIDQMGFPVVTKRVDAI